MQDYQLPPIENVWAKPEEAPPMFQGVARRMFEADAFILVTPEYNGSYSASLKNFLDHFPKQDRKVFGIVSASPGNLGGIRAALQLQNLIFNISGISSPRMLIVPRMEKIFDKSGKLLDQDFENQISLFHDDFSWLSALLHYAKVVRLEKKAA